MVEHSGSTGGYRTDIARFPSVHTSVVTMCNVSTADAVGVAHRVADAAFAPVSRSRCRPRRRVPLRSSRRTPSVTLSDGEVASMTGRYHSDELNADYELSPAGTRVVLKRPRAAADTLRAPDHQTLRGTGITIKFVGAPTAKSAMFTAENGRARGLEFVRTSTIAK